MPPNVPDFSEWQENFLTCNPSPRKQEGAGPKEEQEGDMEDGCQGQVSGSGRGQRELFGTRQKVTFQASAALCVGLPGGRSESTFPGGKQACEHQAQD